MKFTKAIEIVGMESALRSGHLKLQCGQHVTVDGEKARFVEVRSSGGIWVMYDHHQYMGLLKKTKAVKAVSNALKSAARAASLLDELIASFPAAA